MDDEALSGTELEEQAKSSAEPLLEERQVAEQKLFFKLYSPWGWGDG